MPQPQATPDYPGQAVRERVQMLLQNTWSTSNGEQKLNASVSTPVTMATPMMGALYEPTPWMDVFVPATVQAGGAPYTRAGSFQLELKGMEKKRTSKAMLKIVPLPTKASKIQSPPLMDEVTLKHPFSLAVYGMTGSGKTVAVLNLLTHPQMYGQYFDEVFIFSGQIRRLFRRPGTAQAARFHQQNGTRTAQDHPVSEEGC
jgi:hypothetical protein